VRPQKDFWVGRLNPVTSPASRSSRAKETRKRCVLECSEIDPGRTKSYSPPARATRTVADTPAHVRGDSVLSS
jgi:hypothetical protein